MREHIVIGCQRLIRETYKFNYRSTLVSFSHIAAKFPVLLLLPSEFTDCITKLKRRLSGVKRVEYKSRD